MTGRAAPQPAEIVAMSDLLAHRGPDAHGQWCEGAVGLGHRRLSVIDIAGGVQPMTSADDAQVIVFNGEIYNYRQVRQAMPQVTFRTNSDTETLLCMAAEDGIAWLEPLIGMFAFAVWDRKRRRLKLVRDRLGIKPLYYRIADGRFHFASEMKALVRCGTSTAAINSQALPEYLAFRNISGTETLFEGVKEVPPGHMLELDAATGAITFTAYWRDSADLTARGGGFEPGMPIKSALQDAIRYRLVADVPIGTYNSGGVDSSLVTHFVRGMTDGDLHTFSVGFHEATHDESAYALQVAEIVGSLHHKLTIDAVQYADNLPLAIWHNDEPLHHAHTVQLLLLSAEAKQFVTVVLTGEGADELFAGYPRYQIPLLARYLSHLPGNVPGGLNHLCMRAGARRIAKLAEVADDLGRSVVEQARFVPRKDLDAIGIGASAASSRSGKWQELAAEDSPLLERVWRTTGPHTCLRSCSVSTARPWRMALRPGSRSWTTVSWPGAGICRSRRRSALAGTIRWS
ncbi:MAG: asparagine synthase (glutamine-hydrolyzing) [bacterium]|nr:asparagine synthase (glutamine-hydrolyzing) [bacterium]